MTKKFILDTNAYRQLAESLELKDIESFATKLKQLEREKECSSILSVVTTMELLKHLDNSDPHFNSCFKAAGLQFFHSQPKNYGESDNNIDFIPPINTILTQHFFENNSEYLKYYFKIIEILHVTTKNLDVNDIIPNASDIRVVKDQLLHERLEMKNNFEAYIKNFNGGVIDWTFFRKQRHLKKRLLKEIKNGNIKIALAQALEKRAHEILGKQYRQEGLDKKFELFLDFYDPLLCLNQHFFEKIIHGVIALANHEDKKWNTINDMQILAAVCFAYLRDKDNDTEFILVTDDNNIHTVCKGTYLEGKIWKLAKYKEFICLN